MTEPNPAAELRAVVRHLDTVATPEARRLRRALIRMGQTWFRPPAHIRRMHAAYGRRTR